MIKSNSFPFIMAIIFAISFMVGYKFELKRGEEQQQHEKVRIHNLEVTFSQLTEGTMGYAKSITYEKEHPKQARVHLTSKYDQLDYDSQEKVIETIADSVHYAIYRNYLSKKKEPVKVIFYNSVGSKIREVISKNGTGEFLY